MNCGNAMVGTSIVRLQLLGQIIWFRSRRRRRRQWRHRESLQLEPTLRRKRKELVDQVSSSANVQASLLPMPLISSCVLAAWQKKKHKQSWKDCLLHSEQATRKLGVPSTHALFITSRSVFASISTAAYWAEFKAIHLSFSPKLL